MRVALATLCKSMKTRDDGTIDLLGAAPDLVRVAGFPWSGQLTFALVLALEPGEDPADTGMNVSVVRAADGAVVGRVDPRSASQTRGVPSGHDGPVHLAFELWLDTQLPDAGTYGVLVRGKDGSVLANAAFGVAAAE